MIININERSCSNEPCTFVWSRSEFNFAAKQLVQKMQQRVTVDNTNHLYCEENDRYGCTFSKKSSCDRSATFADDWNLMSIENKNCYTSLTSLQIDVTSNQDCWNVALFHPPIRTKCNFLDHARKSCNKRLPEVVLDDDNKQNNFNHDWCHTSLFHERSLHKNPRKDNNNACHDDDSSLMFVDLTIVHDEGTLQLPIIDETQESMMLEWNLSCVYSESWRVPVLYFTVENSSTGQPLSRSEILMYLQGMTNSNSYTNGYFDDDSEDLSWNFISMEEHPITCLPAYFLHPCRTAERLGILKASLHHDDERNTDSQVATLLLMSWLSMMLSELNINISVNTFQSMMLVDGLCESIS